MTPLRFIHFSDAHVKTPRPGWAVGDLFTKRATGWISLQRRKSRFDRALHVLDRLREAAISLNPDGLIFSGDASSLAFAADTQAAATALHVGDLPGIAVPGNHDHYVAAAVRDQQFESAFAPWLEGRRGEPHRYPYVRHFGEVTIVAVNTCRANRLAWDASGHVGSEQLARLDQLLADAPPGPRILVTHYPYCRADGRPENHWHGLSDRTRLAEFAARHQLRLWLCGHLHTGFVLGPTHEMRFALACAGSATQEGKASFLEITIDGFSATIRRHRYESKSDQFMPTNEVSVFPMLFALNH